MEKYLLDIKGLSVEYRVYDGIVKAVSDFNLKVEKGKTIGLVGETGAGKTTTALSIMKLVPSPPGIITSGGICFNNINILEAKEDAVRKLRGNKISMIFQNPMTSLNPVLTVGKQISNVIIQHQKLSETEARKKAAEMLEIVRIPKERLDNYPYEFSGGMRQRVCIAIGLACNPLLLIADEPTTALDVTIQVQILELMNDLKEKYNTSIIFITHDLGVVAEIADYVVVMYAGNIVEQGDIKSIYENPKHPYTKGLFDCLPDVDSDSKRLKIIKGAMPDPMKLPMGCNFCSRCEDALNICYSEKPKVVEVGNSHFVQCHKYSKGSERNE